MIINCGPPIDVRLALRDVLKRNRLQQWHPFFALLPRRLDDNKCVWLEWIRRKGRIVEDSYYGDRWYFEYRLSTVRELEINS